MPVVSRPSPLETDPATELRPGETGIRLRKDPYYGFVDVGAAPSPEAQKKADEEEKARVDRTKDFEKRERERIKELDKEIARGPKPCWTRNWNVAAPTRAARRKRALRPCKPASKRARTCSTAKSRAASRC